MMNEMATLMSKLEIQVAKAANKLDSRAEELKARLSRQVEDFLKEAQDLEKRAESNLNTLSSELKTRLETLAGEVNSNLATESSSGREVLNSLEHSGIEGLELEQTRLSNLVIQASEDFKADMEKLTESVQSRLNSLIGSRNKELTTLRESILEKVKESHDGYAQKVEQRFDRFKERMGEETSSITTSLERNMRSMIDEIDSSMERACEKLRTTKQDLEQTIAHTLAVSEMAIGQRTKKLLADTLLPKLNEQKEILRTMIHDMGKQINLESTNSLKAELDRLEQTIKSTSEKLKAAAEDCLGELEKSGKGLKSGLEETFRTASEELNKRTEEVHRYIKDAERHLQESEHALKLLAESSSFENEAELNDERSLATSKLTMLKQDANKKLSGTIEDCLEKMEDRSDKLFAELTNKRAEHTSQVRDSAEHHLHQIRQALAEATSAIQAAREKNMQ